ncbi:MAG: ThiF family adenylyltransferase [Gammaproteobacteria bacterium]
MNEEQRRRYSRHIQLPFIGSEGQCRLLRSRALIVGLGGLGSPAAIYLSASGVGHLTLVDFDHVELSNLQRQIIHGTSDLGRHKVLSARDRLIELNPDISVTALPRALDNEELEQEIGRADVVLDASDNFETRFELNRACVTAKTPLVCAAAIRMEAQITVFEPARPDSPCYRCLYPNETEADEEACAAFGVLAPLLGVIGSLQAVEALKLLLGIGSQLTGRLLLFDASQMEWRTLRLRKDPQCPVCAQPSGPR